MLSLKLLATAAAVMSSIVAAAPTGKPNADIAETNAPAENNIDCNKEFQKCLNNAPEFPVTLAWYADCADKYRVCVDESSKDIIEPRGELTVDCDALLQECLAFYNPRTLGAQRDCELTYQACQLAHPPKTKREETEEPVTDNSSILTKRSECTDECNKNYDICLYSLGMNPPANWWQYCAELLAECNHDCPDKREVSVSEDSVTENASFLTKRSECTDECNKNYDICLHSLGPNPPANWWQYCSELLAKCNWNCPEKRSTSAVNEESSSNTLTVAERSFAEVDKMAPGTFSSLTKRTECTDECYDNYLVLLGSLGPNPPQH